MHTLRWEWYGLVLLTLGQIILVLRAPAASLPDRLWQAWLVGNPALCLGIVTWRPDAWRQHRAWMVPLLRIITHLVPQQRSSRKGITGLMLGKPPRRGLHGALLDCLRLVAGMRMIGNVMATLLVPMPLPVAAVTNAAIVLLLRNNEPLCQTELLSSPLSRQRLAHLHSLLDACCFMVLPLMPASSVVGQPGGADQACSAALNFVQALCIVLPVALLVWIEPPQCAPVADHRWLEAQPLQHQRHAVTAEVQEGCGWQAGLAAAWRRASIGADSLLRWAFYSKGSWVQRGVHLIVLLDGVWLAVKSYS